MGSSQAFRTARGVVVVAALAGALLTASGGVALSAGPPLEREAPLRYTDSHIEQEAHEDFCPDLEFDVLWTREITAGLFLGVRRGDGLVYFGERAHGTETYENVENGKTLTLRLSGTDRDQRIVDNGDGTLTITVQITGPATAYDSDGNRLFVDAGMFRFQFLVDDGGTPGDPSDDTFLEFLGVTHDAGVRQTAGRDFCADLQEFIG